ncbi:DUF86 domain-containing protein [Rhodoferax antarcticus]|nr:DUF86 domain-containing protein [Rhodoferax antarcticus]
MNSSRIADYLEHMLEAALLACSYVEGLAREDFEQDKRTQQAVILNLIVLAEEATKVLKDNEAFANSHPQIPWRSMKGERTQMAHGYYEINLDTVWQTVQTALPGLIEIYLRCAKRFAERFVFRPLLATEIFIGDSPKCSHTSLCGNSKTTPKARTRPPIWPAPKRCSNPARV